LDEDDLLPLLRDEGEHAALQLVQREVAVRGQFGMAAHEYGVDHGAQRGGFPGIEARQVFIE
jgi:hypothetical protein